MERLEYKIKKMFEVRDYKFKEFVGIYQVDAKTFRKWLHKLNVNAPLNGLYFKIRQVEVIKDVLGFPYLIYDIDYDLSNGRKERKVIKRPFEVRPYKFKELCGLYNKHPNTMRRWLAPFKEKIGPLIGGYYLIPQVETIISCIDLPYTILEVEESEIKERNPRQFKAA